MLGRHQIFTDASNLKRHIASVHDHKLPVLRCQSQGCLQIDSKYDEHSKWYNSLVQNERGELAYLQNGSRRLGSFYKVDAEGRLQSWSPLPADDTFLQKICDGKETDGTADFHC